MALGISLFPTITDEIISKIRYQSTEYQFYYEEDEKRMLDIADVGDSILVKSIVNDGIWTPDENNLGVSREYAFRNYQHLFGENGVACYDAVLGLAVIWTSVDSKQRGAIEVGEISNGQDELRFNLDHLFVAGKLRGSIELTSVIYIKRIGMPSNREKHLANISGCILGEIDKFIIKLDGNNSTFPLYEVSDPGQPLWYVKCEWDDPFHDRFDECISININRANKDYKYLDRSQKTYSDQLMREVIASALVIVVTKLREREGISDLVGVRNDYEKGSIVEAIFYFAEVHGWKMNTPEDLSASIRTFLEKRMSEL